MIYTDAEEEIEKKLIEMGYDKYDIPVIFWDLVNKICAEEKLTAKEFSANFYKSLLKARELLNQNKKSVYRFNLIYHFLIAIKLEQPELLKMEIFQLKKCKDAFSKDFSYSYDEFIKINKRKDYEFLDVIYNAWNNSWIYLHISSILYNSSQKKELYDFVIKNLLKCPYNECRALALEFLFSIELNQKLFPDFELDELFDLLPNVKQIIEYDKIHIPMEPFPTYIAKVILNLGNKEQKLRFNNWLNETSEKLKGEIWLSFLNSIFGEVIADYVFNPLSVQEKNELKSVFDLNKYQKKLATVDKYLKEYDLKPPF